MRSTTATIRRTPQVLEPVPDRSPAVGSAIAGHRRRDERQRREGPADPRLRRHDRAAARPRTPKAGHPAPYNAPVGTLDSREPDHQRQGAESRGDGREDHAGGRTSRTGNSGAHTDMMCQADALGEPPRDARDRPGRCGTARDADVLADGTPTRPPWREGPGPAGSRNQEVTMTTANDHEPRERRLSPAVLVGGAFALTTLLSIAFHVGEILFTDHDPHAPEGPIASIESVAVVGGIGLVLALAIAVPLSRDAAARQGRRDRARCPRRHHAAVVLVRCTGDARRLRRVARRLGTRKPPPDRRRTRLRHRRDRDRRPRDRRDRVRRGRRCPVRDRPPRRPPHPVHRPTAPSGGSRAVVGRRRAALPPSAALPAD